MVNLGERAAIPLDSRARAILLDTNDPRYNGDGPAMLTSSERAGILIDGMS